MKNKNIDLSKFDPLLNYNWKVGYSDGSGTNENEEGYTVVDQNEDLVVLSRKDGWGCTIGISNELTAEAVAAVPHLLRTIKDLKKRLEYDEAEELVGLS